MSKTLSEFLKGYPPRPLSPFASGAEGESPFDLQFSVRRRRDGLDFDFMLHSKVANDLKKIVIPDFLEPAFRRRRDEIWQHTCLEIFVGVEGQDDYFELNLSPSGDWNVYHFDNYRVGMKPADRMRAHSNGLDRSPEDGHDGATLVWSASLSGERREPLNELFGVNSPHCPLVLGATAVLEYTTGEREYWALKHASDKPDFHKRESFLLTL